MGQIFKKAAKIILALYGIPALLAILGVFPFGVLIVSGIIAGVLIIAVYLIEKIYLNDKNTFTP